MADSSAGRLVSFLVEGDEVVSCEVCMEPFHPISRAPKLLPCDHNFCEKCLFSLCCHQQSTMLLLKKRTRGLLLNLHTYKRKRTLLLA